MAVTQTTYRCDWPGCDRTITVRSDGPTLSDYHWEHRLDGRHLVCAGHRFHSSKELEAELYPDDVAILRKALRRIVGLIGPECEVLTGDALSEAVRTAEDALAQTEP